MQPTVEFQQSFQNALSLQQQKKYDEALTAYKSILEQNLDLSRDQIADLSYNASLTAFLKQDYLQSYVYDQKALLLAPRHTQAKELATQIKQHFQVKSIPHDISLLENLNKAGFVTLPVEALWVMTTFFLILFLKSITSFYIKRKNELIENTKLSRFSYKNYVWLILFLISSSLTGLKIWDDQTPKALVKTEQVALKTAAGEDQATLSDLPGGSLVHILRSEKHNDILYYQIKYPGGISGWVKQNDLELVVAQ